MSPVPLWELPRDPALKHDGEGGGCWLHPCRSRAPFPLPFVSISGLLQPPLPAATEPLPFPW